MRNKTAETFWICIVEASTDSGGNRYGLLASNDSGKWKIHGFPSESEGLAYFESTYNRAHKRGYEASMSACVHAIFFRPSILSMTMEQINSMIGEKGGGVQMWSNNAGRMDVITLVAARAKRWWVKGARPKLIEDRAVACA